MGSSCSCDRAPAVGEDGPVNELDFHEFTIDLHSAHLNRSFANFGWMDPYAIIAVDGKEEARTKAAKFEHKEPKWESTFSVSHDDACPSVVSVAVWDKNHFHKDVFCGSVTIPCEVAMGKLDHMEFNISKNGQNTGSVTVSLHAKVVQAVHQADHSKHVASMEFDHLLAWLSGKSKLVLHLEEHDHAKPISAGGHEEEDEAHAAVDAKKSAVSKDWKLTPELYGAWKCTDTFGLEEFLKASNIGVFQRKIAMAAKWPAWEFSEQDGRVIFVNHSALGDLKEEIHIGEDYEFKDGHGNLMTCRATWEATSTGGTLNIERSGKIANYTEVRRVEGNKLHFTLTHEIGGTWGRSFERDG